MPRDGDVCRDGRKAPVKFLGEIMARKRFDAPSIEQRECLPVLGLAVESSERPMAPARRDRPRSIRGIPARLVPSAERVQARGLPVQGDQQMEPIYLRTRLPIGECRRRLEDRVGKPRWRSGFVWLGLLFGRYCERPLHGTVEQGGFDVAETGTRGWGTRAPLMRGQWTTTGDWTVLRLQPYVRWGSWAEQVFAGVVCGGVLTFIAITIAGTMSDSTACACLLAFSIVSIAALVWLHSRQLLSLARDLARRFGVLFEAELMEEPEGGQFDMHFGV